MRNCIFTNNTYDTCNLSPPGLSNHIHSEVDALQGEMWSLVLAQHVSSVGLAPFSGLQLLFSFDFLPFVLVIQTLLLFSQQLKTFLFATISSNAKKYYWLLFLFYELEKVQNFYLCITFLVIFCYKNYKNVSLESLLVTHSTNVWK